MDQFMENIIFLGNETTSSQEDLPWVKDWVKSTKEPGIPQEVITCYSGDKGLLLETGLYKSFIFRKESTYGFLVEALEQWTSTKQEVFPLIIAATTKGKAQYGLHQDKPKVVWVFDENKYRSIRVDGKLPVIKHKTNPFLQSDSPTPVSNNGKISQEPTEADEANATARKVKKPT